MDSLSKNEVLHIANLAMLELSDDEILKYGVSLKALFNEIDKINDINISDVDIMISPSSKEIEMFDDNYVVSSNNKELIDNSPSSFENFIEVAGVFDE